MKDGSHILHIQYGWRARRFVTNIVKGKPQAQFCHIDSGGWDAWDHGVFTNFLNIGPDPREAC